MHILFFQKKSVDNFEIEHKHANFWLGVQLTLKVKRDKHIPAHFLRVMRKWKSINKVANFHKLICESESNFT